jgi:hypothetical protein
MRISSNPFQDFRILRSTVYRRLDLSSNGQVVQVEEMVYLTVGWVQKREEVEVLMVEKPEVVEGRSMARLSVCKMRCEQLAWQSSFVILVKESMGLQQEAEEAVLMVLIVKAVLMALSSVEVEALGGALG